MCVCGGPIGDCAVENIARWQLMADGLGREEWCLVQWSGQMMANSPISSQLLEGLMQCTHGR
jgi:hypothetical protein